MLATASACTGPPRVLTPLPPDPDPAHRATRCDESVFAVDLDPATTLDFRPAHCRLDLGGWYAVREALLDRPQVDLSLFCQDPRPDERALSIRYHGAPVGEGPITDLWDPFHTGDREGASTVNYSFVSPRGLDRHRFERGELWFHRPPRPRREVDPSAHGSYVEIGLDLRFEGDRRFRAALRICPTYARTGPVSDPVGPRNAPLEGPGAPVN